MLLGDTEIKKMIESKDLIENFLSLSSQLQPSGFEFTVSNIFRIDKNDFGAIDFDNSKRKIPKYIHMKWKDNQIVLDPDYYIIETNERINMPDDLVGIINPRSSLHRIGLVLREALIDPGYRGVLTLGLIAFGRVIIWQNARIFQVSFMKVKKASTIYSGTYQDYVGSLQTKRTE